MKILSMPLTEKAIYQDIEQESSLSLRLEFFFMGIEHKINFYSYNQKKTVVDVVYTDFLPVRIVKGIIRKMLPSTFCLTVCREYSPRIIAETLYKEFRKNDVGVIDCINGSLEARPIRQFVNDILDERSFMEKKRSNQDIIETSQN